MAGFYTFLYFVVFLLKDGVRSATWNAVSLQDRQQLYACAGDNVTLTWQYIINAGEELADIQWLYNGHSQELVAMYSQGIFLPSPSFSQRVTLVNNAGLTLSKVLMQDSGNYSVRVNFDSQAGTLHTLLHRAVTLHVSEHLMTTDGALHVVQNPNPVYNSATSQWVIQLQCGHFIFQENPPFFVQWTTPSGHVYYSTYFSQGIFYFDIPMPVETGNYVCSIPTNMAARACLHGNSQGGASVRMESVEARLLLLETRLRKVEDAERNQVAFHATRISAPSVQVAGITPLVFPEVVYNQGNAYNSSTGVFSAPYSGIYFFIAKSAAYRQGGEEFHELMVGNIYIDSAHSTRKEGSTWGETSSVHAVVHLNQGQQVYVNDPVQLSLSDYDPSYSSFSGFLLSRDP